MSQELIPFKPSDDRSYDEQLRDALEKALTIQGTIINDLEAAINALLQTERPLVVAGVPHPYQATINYLKAKYKMSRKTADESERNSRALLEASKPPLTNTDVLELTRGSVVESDEIVDAEVVDG